jgi:hypothetical protein
MIIREFIGLWRFIVPLAGLGGTAITGVLLYHHDGIIASIGSGVFFFAFVMLNVTIGGLLGLGMGAMLNALWK